MSRTVMNFFIDLGWFTIEESRDKRVIAEKLREGFEQDAKKYLTDTSRWRR
jgi:hypothetical protein